MGIDYIKSEIKLTIGILVSNRIKYIRDVMEALQPLLRAVPSELIAVDTKGAASDGSINVVKEYTDNIYPFTWCNDFSAARNVTLEHAHGEWYLFLDDDEVFDDVQELIEFFQSGEYKKYGAGYYCVKNYTAEGGQRTSIVGRMVRRTPNTRFVGRVHEYFNEVHEPYKTFSCFVHHYGYKFETEEEKKLHQERNITLLRQELKERGMTPRICAQLMQELLSRKETVASGYEFFVKSIEILKRKFAVTDECFQWMLVGSVRCFSILKDYEGLLKQAKEIRMKYSLNQVADMALAGIVIENAVDHSDVPVILAYSKVYRQAWNWMKTHEKEAIPQVQLDFTNFITEKYASEVFRVEKACADAAKEQGGKTVPTLIKSDIKLTIGMLVSNHKQYIRNAMEALKPLLDAVPSELVVIDTVGEKTDGSIDIVKEYTDKIYPFTWCNDFSAARNFCLSKAQGEWFLYQDDDEWFDNVQEFIDFFVSGECEKYYTGFYYTRDYDADGSYSIGIAGRMIRRTVDTRFEGKVHETFNEVYAPNKQFSCFTHHYGYAYSSPEARAKHQERNVTILQEMLKEEGYTSKICVQLAQEYLSVEETSETGYRFCLEAIEKLKEAGETEDSAFQWLLVSTVRHFSRTNEHDKLMAQAAAIEESFALSNIAAMALAATVVLSALQNDDIQAVQKYAPVYLENWKWKEANLEEALLQTQLDFPKYLDERYYRDISRAAGLAEEYYKNKVKETKKMKRLRKEEMTGIVTTLRKANRLTTTKGMTAEQLTNILTKCQESAIVLGEALERHGEAGEAVIRLLEEYCEALYLQSQNYGNEAVLSEFRTGINALLDLVEDGINGLVEKKLVVFLPYKAAMWDSLESVWMAAEEDDACEAKVMPIPYYNKRQDGSLRELHDEQGDFPSYVPITDWRTYDLKTEHPDVIFFHNPYDEYNYVTSVYPQFYSGELKKCTDLLVYIPYFVSGERVNDHLCATMGVYNADKVVVQPGNIYETYKRVYVESLLELNGEKMSAAEKKQYELKLKEEAEQKFLPLGSPKLDRVTNYKKISYDIPEEWQKLIGSGENRKKVVLLNFHLSSVAYDRVEFFLKDVDRVFDTFKQAKGIVLLWRPHPLMESTIVSMAPAIRDWYRKIVEKYRSEGWGIYDDTPDFNRAVDIADAYYGDHSSLVAIFKAAGKPVMIRKAKE